MPTTVSLILNDAGLTLMGPVKWRETIPSHNSGIYIVSLSSDPDKNFGVLEKPPISLKAVQAWLDKTPNFKLDRILHPSARQVVSHLSKFWLPDENILYIGKTDSALNRRVRQYYRTPLGKSKPHHGGYWLKTLSNLQELFVHFAEYTDTKNCETHTLKFFSTNVSPATLSKLYDRIHPFPFANLEIVERKLHGISDATYE